MNLNNQNFFSRDSFCTEFLENQDDMKDLLLENNFLKEQIELFKKTLENQKFEYENKIKNYEREITKLKSSLNSANEMIEVYKVIDKQNQNSGIKDIVEKLKLKNNDLEQINLLLKRENADVISELENLKMKVKGLNANKNVNSSAKGETEIKEIENINNAYSIKNFNSISSTNQGSSLNVNLQNQLSNETINFNGKIDNSNNNKINDCPTNLNGSFENKENIENEENSKNVNNQKTSENEQAINEMSESGSIASDMSFSSKNTNQLKLIFLKIKKEKNRIYDNAVELMTENEIEIKTLKNENEDLKYALSKYEEELVKMKTYLRERHNINLDENEMLFNIEEKSYEDLETCISNYQTEKKNLNNNTENSIKRDIKAFENNSVGFITEDPTKNLDLNRDSYKESTLHNAVNKYFHENQNLDMNKSFTNSQIELKDIPVNSPLKKNKTEEDRYLSSDKYNNSFEQEKNDLRNLIESLETKLFETSKNYEERITRLKQELENTELERNQYQQELENIQSNKKNLVEDIEYYSVTVRSLQDQKERLEDNLKNKIDYLIAENKILEQTLTKSQDQVFLLEKENKEIKETEGKRNSKLKEKFAKEKEAFDAKFKELTNRFFECNKEKESLKKDNENLKQVLERKKLEIEELIEKRLRAKEKKENEINSINEKYTKLIERLEAGCHVKINKCQEKIKSLYAIIEKNIEEINSLKKEFNTDEGKRSKSIIMNKEQISKTKWNKNMLNTNYQSNKNNINDAYKDIDLQLSNGQINESLIEYENKFQREKDRNENFDKEITANEEVKKNGINQDSDDKSKESNFFSFNDQKSNEASDPSKEYDLSTSPIEKKIKFLDPENRKDNEFIDLYGFDPKKNNVNNLKYVNSLNFHSEISSNSAINSYLNECSCKVPLEFALEEDSSSQNKFKYDHEDIVNNRRKSSKLIFNKRRSSMTVFKKFIRENLKKKLKRKGSKKLFGGLISTATEEKTQADKDENSKENMKDKFDFMVLKKTLEKEINELKSKNAELVEKVKKLEEESHNIDNILIINELKEKTMLLTQENKNLKDEIQVLKTDLITLEENKNEYIQKLKKDVEKAEDLAAKTKFSLGQVNFEKDSEILKYRNYCKKLRLTVKALEQNNSIMAENINSLNSKKILNKNV